MRRFLFKCFALAGAILSQTTATYAVDLESFEFNDAAGTLLAGAANTANPGNFWVEDGGMTPSGMLPSDVRAGSYNIVKGSLVLESNYLNIANISSGTYYLTARMSNWQFGDTFVANEPEEFRLAFLNDDDPPGFGATITAQMQLRRNAAGNVEIIGDAILTGPDSVLPPAPVNAVQTQPFTAVLELNKTSNTYKVFFKDGSNPTQVLGIGNVDPDRGGNAIRMAANNDFSEFSADYPFDTYEVFGIDRIALSNTNPLTDLITLEISRADGSMTLRNTSGTALTGLESYSIESTTGAFDPTKWKTVMGNYDSVGNGSVDNAPWAVTTSTKLELAEAFQSGDGGGLTNNQNVVLNLPGGGTWLKSPFEDVQMTLNFAGGIVRTVNVNFTGNLGERWAEGDFDFDRDIDATDWLLFIEDAETNLSGLSRVERYQRGDLNGDGFNNIVDFGLFETLFDDANGGAGAFEEMLAGFSIPEPTTISLLIVAATVCLGGRRRPRANWLIESPDEAKHAMSNILTGEFTMRRVQRGLRLFCIAIAVACLAPASDAAILEEFTFSEPNDTPLEVTDNSINPSNSWILGGNSFDPSAVLNGSYRITKSSAQLATAHLDMANVSTGKVWLVAEVAGWNYTATPSATSEQVRFAFLDNDNDPPSGSTITAQMDIRRQGAGLALVGIGALGTGATDIAGSFALPLVRSTPFNMVLELDKVLDKYSVYYKDDTNPYQLLGTAELGLSTLNSGDRDGNSIRFAPTGAFNDVGEFVDINRIYLTDTSPIGGPVEPVALTLQVFSDGNVSILNSTDDPISFNSYRVLSPTDDLDVIGWNSLSEQNIDLVDGPDADETPGNSPGESWDVAGGSDAGVLAESFLLGSTTIAPTNAVDLGGAFQVGGNNSLLSFQYRDSVTGAIVTGDIDFQVVAGLDGDFNQDGVVDAADYVMWRKTNAGSYAVWRENFGESLTGSGTVSLTSSVPEPASCWIVAFTVISICSYRSKMHRR
jgi:hypothetical protein